MVEYEGEELLAVQAPNGDTVFFYPTDFEVLIDCYQKLLVKLAKKGVKH